MNLNLKRPKFLFLSTLLLTGFFVLPSLGEVQAAEDSEIVRWGELEPIPNQTGLAGMVAGIHNGQLIAGGGANFPTAPPWQNGTKVWHDQIYVMDLNRGVWRSVKQKLPKAVAYGVSLSHPDGVVVCGGDNGQQVFSDVYRLTYQNERVELERLPPLPSPCTQMSGAIVGDLLYLAGGMDRLDATQASDKFWSLNLKTGKQWTELPRLPTGRIQAIAGVQGGSFFLFGGIHLKADSDGKSTRVTPYLKEAWKYAPSSATTGKWIPISEMPNAAAAAPSPAFPAGQTHLLILGGVDGSLFQADQATHPGFPGRVLSYNPVTDRWAQAGTIPTEDARVTAPCIASGGRGIIVSGESRPGIRSPRVMDVSLLREEQSFGILNWSVLVVYLLGLVIIGFYFARRESSTNDFFLAGGRVPWWAAGLSIFATMLSAITYLAIPARSYSTNWIFFLVNCGILAIAPVIIVVYLPFFRRLQVTTAYEYLEKRFSLGIRLVGSLSFIIFQFGRMGIVVLLPALALSAVTGINVYVCIIVMGTLSTLYTVLGGIEAVIWTDVLQTVVLLGGALAAIITVILQVDGGLATIWETARANQKLQLINPSWSLVNDGIIVMILAAIFNNLVSYSTDQAVIQRYLTTKDEEASSRAIWTNALLAIPASALFFFVGTALYVFYQSRPASLHPLAKTDQVFAWFIAREMPPGLSGLVIAGIFAAAMSSLDSSIHSVSTAITTDFIRRFRPNLGERHFLNIARGLTLILGIVGTITATIMAGQDIQSLWTFFLGLIGLFGGTLCGLFLLGIFTRRTAAIHAWIGIVFSIVALTVARFGFELNSLLFAAIGSTTCLLTGWLAAIIIRQQPKNLDGLTR
ncbi:MAG: sodium/solute symporter [Planctomycetaceae bacterium]|nr:sodium/solute symporter [Planctomycetaceae bacterium]